MPVTVAPDGICVGSSDDQDVPRPASPFSVHGIAGCFAFGEGRSPVMVLQPAFENDPAALPNRDDDKGCAVDAAVLENREHWK